MIDLDAVRNDGDALFRDSRLLHEFVADHLGHTDRVLRKSREDTVSPAPERGLGRSRQAESVIGQLRHEKRVGVKYDRYPSADAGRSADEQALEVMRVD